MSRSIIGYREYDPIHDIFSAIQNFDLEALQKKYDEGTRFFAFFSDSTKEEVKPEEIRRLGEMKQESFQFVQPAYVNERAQAIFNILDGIMDPLLEILPDDAEEESVEEEIAVAQSVPLRATAKKAALAKASTTYKDRVREAFQNLKTLVEQGEQQDENDE